MIGDLAEASSSNRRRSWTPASCVTHHKLPIRLKYVTYAAGIPTAIANTRKVSATVPEV